MKFFCLLSLLIITHYCQGMELTNSVTFYSLSKDILAKIIACADLTTQKILRCTNKQFSLITINDLVHHSPLIISRKDHIYYLVHLAKTHSIEKNNEWLIKNLIHNAAICDHEDVLDLLTIFNFNIRPEINIGETDIYAITNKCFISYMAGGDRNLLAIRVKQFPHLKEMMQKHRDHLSKLDTLFDQVLALYRGDKALMDQYICIISRLSDLIEKEKQEINPLYLAAKTNNIAMVELLLAQSHDLINALGPFGKTPLFVARNIEISKMLLSCEGINPNRRPYLGRNCRLTPLYTAVAEKNKERQNLFLSYPGFIINEENEDGVTPLHEAAARNDLDVFKFFFEHADKGQVRSDIKPIHEAAYNNSYDIVNFILENDPTQIDLKTEEGETALFIASYTGNLDIVELLLSKGALVNCTDNELQTPLWEATCKGDIDIAHLLLDYGADQHARNKDGISPLMFVAENGSDEIKTLFIEHDNAVSTVDTALCEKK